MNVFIMVFIIMIIMVVVSIIPLCIFSLSWKTHREMTIDNCATWSYGSFEQFLKQWSKHKNWKRDPDHPKSWFNDVDFETIGSYMESNLYKIHAGIIKFNGVGMVLRGKDYRKFVTWREENTLKKPNTFIENYWEDKND